MSTQVQFRRGTAAEHSSFTGAIAEITVDTTDYRPVVHDGTTEGGYPVALEADLGTYLNESDLGVTVQEYDVATAKTDEAANFTAGLQASGVDVLTDSDLGTTVQEYDADTAKYDDVTANFTGTLQNNGSNVLVDSDIGTTVQAFGTTVFPINFISGGVVSNNSVTPASVLDITAANARSSDNTVDISTSADSLSILSAANWASGAVPTLTNATVHVWAVSDTVDYIIFDNATGSNIANPKRRIGSVLCDASSNIIEFSSKETSEGVRYRYNISILDVELTTLSTGARAAVSLSVPAGIEVLPHISLYLFDNDSTVAVIKLTEENETDLAVSSSTGSHIVCNNTVAVATIADIKTNSSKQIYYRSNDSSVTIFRIVTLGFVDWRI